MVRSHLKQLLKKSLILTKSRIQFIESKRKAQFHWKIYGSFAAEVHLTEVSDLKYLNSSSERENKRRMPSDNFVASLLENNTGRTGKVNEKKKKKKEKSKGYCLVCY